MPLNFGGQKRSGAFDTVWPSAATDFAQTKHGEAESRSESLHHDNVQTRPHTARSTRKALGALLSHLARKRRTVALLVLLLPAGADNNLMLVKLGWAGCLSPGRRIFRFIRVRLEVVGLRNTHAAWSACSRNVGFDS